MKPEAKMLFGVRASQGVTFTATVATAPPHPPALLRYAPGQSVTEVEASGNTWTFALSAGDYVLYMPVEDWFEGTISIVFTGEVTVFKPAVPSQSIQGWSFVSGQAGDPKDPWPPPQSPQSYNTSQAQWLIDTLTSLYDGISLDRSLLSGGKASASTPPSGERSL